MQHDAFRHGALGKNILETHKVIIASPSGPTLDDIGQQSRYQPLTIKRHVTELLSYGLVKLEDDRYYADLSDLEAKLARVAGALGAEGKGDRDRQCHELERTGYKEALQHGVNHKKGSKWNTLTISRARRR